MTDERITHQRRYLDPPTCPLCQRRMIPVHGHYECRATGGCGYRDSCCEGGEC